MMVDAAGSNAADPEAAFLEGARSLCFFVGARRPHKKAATCTSLVQKHGTPSVTQRRIRPLRGLRRWRVAAAQAGLHTRCLKNS